jgi:hypothetical protein
MVRALDGGQLRSKPARTSDWSRQHPSEAQSRLQILRRRRIARERVELSTERAAQLPRAPPEPRGAEEKLVDAAFSFRGTSVIRGGARHQPHDRRRPGTSTPAEFSASDSDPFSDMIHAACADHLSGRHIFAQCFGELRAEFQMRVHELRRGERHPLVERDVRVIAALEYLKKA